MRNNSETSSNHRTLSCPGCGIDIVYSIEHKLHICEFCKQNSYFKIVDGIATAFPIQTCISKKTDEPREFTDITIITVLPFIIMALGIMFGLFYDSIPFMTKSTPFDVSPAHGIVLWCIFIAQIPVIIRWYNQAKSHKTNKTNTFFRLFWFAISCILFYYFADHKIYTTYVHITGTMNNENVNLIGYIPCKRDNCLGSTSSHERANILSIGGYIRLEHMGSKLTEISPVCRECWKDDSETFN